MGRLHKIVCFLITCLTLVGCATTQKTTTKTEEIKQPQRKIIVRQAPSFEEAKKDTIRFVPDEFSSLIEMETAYGIMKLELFFDAGKHRENFIKLVKEGFYDSLMFHRVIRNFMIQGGDPNSRTATKGQQLGSGGPGYKVDAEFGNHYYHVKGALAAARQGDGMNPEKKSSGSQFYIVQGSSVAPGTLDQLERRNDMVYSEEQRKLYYKYGGSPQLDTEYTVFGRVYEGFEVIDKIAAEQTNAWARPLKDLRFKCRVIKN